MRFAFTDDQLLFSSALRDLLDNECPPSAVRSAWDDESGHIPHLWSRLAEMGVLSILVPESAGGLGGTFVDAILLFQELGRAAVPGPVLEHMAVAAPALAETSWAAGLIDGSTIATVHLDSEPFVAHAACSHLVVTSRGVLRDFTAVDAHGVDGGRRIASVSGGTLTDVAMTGLAPGDALALAASAYLIGVSERMIVMAADYARQREQFGKPIGSFQAVKHLMSDALLKVEFAKAPTYRAAWSASTGADTAKRDISMAKALASDAAYRASRSSMQVHGGIGYTWEADLQLWMKKAWVLQRAFGDATWHRRRVASEVLDS